MHLGERCRDRGDEEYWEDPRAERGEERGVAEQRDEVLSEQEAVAHEREGPRRGLAARTRELVVKLGVLEERELETESLLEDGGIQIRPHASRQQLTNETERALGRGQRQNCAELEHDPVQGAPWVGSDHGIDDALADVRDGQREQGGQRGKADLECEQLARRERNEAHGADGIAEHLDDGLDPSSRSLRGSFRRGPRPPQRMHRLVLTDAARQSDLPIRTTGRAK